MDRQTDLQLLTWPCWAIQSQEAEEKESKHLLFVLIEEGRWLQKERDKAHCPTLASVMKPEVYCHALAEIY